MDKRVDLATAVFFIGLGLALFVAAAQVKHGSVDDPLGERGLPIVASVLMAASGAGIALRRVRKWGDTQGYLVAHEGMPDDETKPALARRSFAILAALASYVPGLGALGYTLATPLLVATLLWLLEVRAPLRIVAISIGFTVVTYVLVAVVFGINLPAGPLRFLGR